MIFNISNSIQSFQINDYIYLCAILKNDDMIQLIKTDLNEVSALRLKYLNTLPQSQEYFLEQQLSEANIFIIRDKENTVGYAVKTAEENLIELHIEDSHVRHSNDIFETVLNQLDIHAVYCKSFDSLLLHCCIMKNLPYSPAGVLYRNYISTDNALSKVQLSIRYAEISDYPYIIQHGGDITEYVDEHSIVAGTVILFEKNTHLAGCGFLTRIHENFDFFDIGMWVNPDFRGQGIATQIISWLKETCLKNHWIPVCAHGTDNIASQKALEKNGFVSRYSLIEFHVK
jgi:GNAT superfamily N-acetyltransferase